MREYYQSIHRMRILAEEDSDQHEHSNEERGKDDETHPELRLTSDHEVEEDLKISFSQFFAIFLSGKVRYSGALSKGYHGIYSISSLHEYLAGQGRDRLRGINRGRHFYSYILLTDASAASPE